jgi:hypothetical protein
MTKRIESLLREIMENGLVFDVRTDTNDNGGGKVREYRCPARHRIVPYTSIRKSLSSAGHRAGLGHVRPHDLRHTFVTRLLDLGVPIEQVNYLAGHKSMAMTKRYDRHSHVLRTCFHQDVGGPKVVADILNLTGSSVEKNVLDNMDGMDPEVAESVRNLMFVFNDIGRLTDRELQTLMREVDQKDLVIALKTASEELRDKILGNMSEGVRTFIYGRNGNSRPHAPLRGRRSTAAHRAAGAQARRTGTNHYRTRRIRRPIRLDANCSYNRKRPALAGRPFSVFITTFSGRAARPSCVPKSGVRPQ